MALTKARSCIGCRALCKNPSAPGGKCLLGFGVVRLAVRGLCVVPMLKPPTAGCPKPKNYTQLFDAQKRYTNGIAVRDHCG